MRFQKIKTMDNFRKIATTPKFEGVL